LPDDTEVGRRRQRGGGRSAVIGRVGVDQRL